jgi:hypothetical protein
LHFEAAKSFSFANHRDICKNKFVKNNQGAGFARAMAQNGQL